MENGSALLNQTGGDNTLPLEIIRAGADAANESDNNERINNNLAVYYYNTGNALYEKPKYEQAIRNYERSIEKKPDFPEAYHNMGNAFKELGKVDLALECYSKALEIKPVFAEALFNIGNLLSSMGDTEEAIIHFYKALKVKEKFPEANVNLGNLLCVVGRIDQGIDQYNLAIKSAPNFPEAYCGMGNALNAKGRHGLASKYFKKALELRPNFVQAKKGLNRASQARVPIWHFAMMNDKPRNEAYRKAILKEVREDSTVFEIGTGAGLLSMMAASAGAKHVTSCEMVTPVAEKAREIIERNGFSEKITVLNKKSQNIKIGCDMADKADLLISEVFDVGLLGEGAIAAINHARLNLLTADARVIPKAAVVYAAVVDSPKLFEYNRVENIEGFDLSSFNEFATSSYFQMQLKTMPHRMLSEPFKVFSFDFTGDSIKNDERKIAIKMSENGIAHAIVFWFKLQLSDDIFIDTAPGSESHWQQAVQLLTTPIRLSKNQNVLVLAEHNCHEISFDIGISC